MDNAELDARTTALTAAIQNAFDGAGDSERRDLAAVLVGALPDDATASLLVGQIIDQHAMVGQWFTAEEHFPVIGGEAEQGWDQITGPVRIIDEVGEDCGVVGSWREVNLESQQDFFSRLTSELLRNQLPVGRRGEDGE